MRTCETCGEDISERGHRAKFCIPCATKRQSIRIKEYNSGYTERVRLGLISPHKRTSLASVPSTSSVVCPRCAVGPVLTIGHSKVGDLTCKSCGLVFLPPG